MSTACQKIEVRRYAFNEKRLSTSSALHMASKNGLAGTVAKLLSLGANAGLADEVRACAYVKTCVHTRSRPYILVIYQGRRQERGDWQGSSSCDGDYALLKLQATGASIVRNNRYHTHIHIVCCMCKHVYLCVCICMFLIVCM